MHEIDSDKIAQGNTEDLEDFTENLHLIRGTLLNLKVIFILPACEAIKVSAECGEEPHTERETEGGNGD